MQMLALGIMNSCGACMDPLTHVALAWLSIMGDTRKWVGGFQEGGGGHTAASCRRSALCSIRHAELRIHTPRGNRPPSNTVQKHVIALCNCVLR